MDWVEITKSRMTELGLTQADLMVPLGVTTRGAVGHYLNRRRDLSPKQMRELAKKLRLSMDQLFGAVESEATSSSQSVSEQRAKIAAVVRVTDYVRDVALEPIPAEKHQDVIEAAIRVVEAIGVDRILDGTGIADAARQVAAELRSAR